MKLDDLRAIVADYQQEYSFISNVTPKCLHCVLGDKQFKGESLDDFCLLVTLKEPVEGLPEQYKGLPVFYELGHEIRFKG